MNDDFWLMGDENCGVSVYCRRCPWDGGRPIIYYGQSSSGSGYSIDEVVLVENVVDLIAALGEHEAKHTEEP